MAYFCRSRPPVPARCGGATQTPAVYRHGPLRLHQGVLLCTSHVRKRGSQCLASPWLGEGRDDWPWTGLRLVARAWTPTVTDTRKPPCLANVFRAGHIRRGDVAEVLPPPSSSWSTDRALEYPRRNLAPCGPITLSNRYARQRTDSLRKFLHPLDHGPSLF